MACYIFRFRLRPAMDQMALQLEWRPWILWGFMAPAAGVAEAMQQRRGLEQMELAA
jgi:hypothetical protein